MGVYGTFNAELNYEASKAFFFVLVLCIRGTWQLFLDDAIPQSESRLYSVQSGQIAARLQGQNYNASL